MLSISSNCKKLFWFQLGNMAIWQDQKNIQKQLLLLNSLNQKKFSSECKTKIVSSEQLTHPKNYHFTVILDFNINNQQMVGDMKRATL